MLPSCTKVWHNLKQRYDDDDDDDEPSLVIHFLHSSHWGHCSMTTNIPFSKCRSFDTPVQTLFICLFQIFGTVFLCFQNPMSFFLWLLIGMRWFQATQIFLAYSLFHLQVQATLSFLNLHLEVSYFQIHINFANVREFPHWAILYFILRSLSFFALISCHWIVLRRHKLGRESCWTEVTEREWVLLGFERPHSVCTTVLKTSLSVANKVPEVLALGKYLEK